MKHKLLSFTIGNQQPQYGEEIKPMGYDEENEKWNFKTMGDLECIILSRRLGIPSTQSQGQTFDAYTVQDRRSGETFYITCNVVLADRLSLTEDGKAYKICYLGTKPGKRYDMYAVYPDVAFNQQVDAQKGMSTAQPMQPVQQVPQQPVQQVPQQPVQQVPQQPVQQPVQQVPQQPLQNQYQQPVQQPMTGQPMTGQPMTGQPVQQQPMTGQPQGSTDEDFNIF